MATTKTQGRKNPATKAAPAATPTFEPSPSVRASRVGSVLGGSRATGYVCMKEPDFPKPRKISSRFVVYDRAELLAWRDKRKAGSA